MVALYGAFVLLSWAVILPYRFVVGLARGRPRLDLGERLGLVRVPASVAGRAVWVHAVSVGEVRLALLLIGALRRRFTDLPAVLTTGTPTGRALAEAVEPGSGSAFDRVTALPIDLPGPMGRFLDRVRPRAVLILETEIWPNLLRECARRGIPVAIVNGRISPRAFPRYRRVSGLLRRALEGVSLCAMQTAEDAGRIRALGAPGERVEVLGSLKFDLPLPSGGGEGLRRRLGLDGDPLFVAGSTAPGEEKAVLAALRSLRAVDGRVRLVLAPRHPRRFARAAAILHAAGLRAERWSGLPRAGARPATWDALLIDVLGVLPQVYAAADVVFVGGSLTRRGGQNLIEPAALGRPVLFGPHVENFRAAADVLIAAGGGFMARDSEDLARLAVWLLTDPEARRRAGERARAAVETQRGALDRTVDRLVSVIDPAGSGRRSSGLL